ncbi:PREDICTED: putative uncharacterized protein DDB_G0291608 isoform X2 [Drosophila arizonae]|uniref:Uncharacterized protein n=1 Tax=Drosophila arizonae TaxID=7263 RepID=A0ABM1P5L7_DROAR|nr:PREDICTED: putative uncharacterized protein DDB_G0291608 isoform X2 [Drosophila arizonae]
MVLTNFECWAHGDSAPVHFESGPPARHSPVVDPFNARVVSHIATASNGYYGYAIVNNAVAASDDNNNSCSNNNIQAMQMQVNDNIGDDSTQAAAADAAAAAAATARCKKRCFAMGHEKLDMEMDNLTAVKRCRFDDADLVAQYCNDFFSMPATQMIGTQACLMDYDNDVQQQQQLQQHQQQHEQTQLQQQHQQHQQSTQQQQQQQLLHPRIHQHYQGHLHRANRDTANDNLNSHNNLKNYAIP